MTVRVDSHDWGTMTWLADAEAGGTTTVSVARMVLHPGQHSPLHHHPNCEEIVLLESGEVSHQLDGSPVQHEAGTCVIIPAGVAHTTRNLGSAPARLFITYGAPVREYVAGAREGTG
jgi:mannose-6-phosphate isomerase-like protein (cupin superfamily)